MKTHRSDSLTSICIAIRFLGVQKSAARLGRRIVLVALLSAIGFSSVVSAVDQPSMTVILVRHAEKKIEPENKDPDLSPAGLARAQELVRIFSNTGITAIYATQFKRTQQTVKPLADRLGLPVTQVEAKKTTDLVKQIRARNTGEVIFVAGHNNSVPEIIAALGGPQLPIIPETEYDNLYILTVQGDGSAKLLKLKYGSGQPVMGQGMMSSSIEVERRNDAIGSTGGLN
jgi:2,3-bisphosphoglycerate-dependent phosphoglycerate mutase